MTSLLFISLAAICNAFMDVTDRFLSKSKLKYWDPEFWDKAKSSPRKWKNGNKPEGEAFFGSSTFLVFLTSGWHLFKMGVLVFISLAVVFYKPVLHLTTNIFLVNAIGITLICIVWGLVFEGVYRWLKD